MKLTKINEINKELQDFHISAYKYDELYEIRNRIKHKLEIRKNNKKHEDMETEKGEILDEVRN